MCRAMQENYDEGRMEERERLVIGLLREGDYPLEKIAKLSQLPLSTIAFLKEDVDKEARKPRQGLS